MAFAMLRGITVLALLVCTSATEPDTFVVAGYAPEYRLDGLALPVIGEHLSHVLLFSISPKAFPSQKVESAQATVTPSKCLSLFEGFDGLDHLCGMEIGLHLGPNPFNQALWVDPERNSMNAIKRFAHELLGAPDTIGLHDFL